MGDTTNPFIYWLERNAFWLMLALLGTVVAAVWLLWTIKAFPEEIRDIYTTSTLPFHRMLSSWRRRIRRQKHIRQARYHKVRYLKKIRNPQVRLEMEERNFPPSNQSIPKPITTQNASKMRRTRIRIIDEIYGEIVGYQDPSYQNSSNPIVRGQIKDVSDKPKMDYANINNYRRGLAPFHLHGVQPRCHVKGNSFKPEKEENGDSKNPRNNSSKATISVPVRLDTRRAECERSGMISTPNSQRTLEIIRMRETACRIQREREDESKARKARLQKAVEKQYEDLTEIFV